MDIVATVVNVEPEVDYGNPVDMVTVKYEETRSVWHTTRGAYALGQEVPAKLNPTPGGLLQEITPA